LNKLNISFSPIHSLKINAPGNINILVKREDLLHPEFGGNKWRKLKYNIEAFKNGNYSHIISFGGAFSNHIAALANICNHYSIPSVAIIRGEFDDPDNPTITKARSKGMHVHFVPKQEYRLKEESDLISSIINSYDNPFIVPEGGSNQYAFKGVSEIQDEINNQKVKPDYIFLAAGTGMTAAGIISKSKPEQYIYVINIMRNLEMEDMISKNVDGEHDNWEVIHDYHFGGYARVNQDLIYFINGHYRKYEFALDPVYNGKVFYAVAKLIEKGIIEDDSRILIIHTGGNQGIKAYNYCCKDEALRLITE